MATAAARRASDDDLWVCCASRMAHTTDIRVSRPHRAEKPKVLPSSCGSEFVRRFGGHRIGARRRRVDPRVNRAGGQHCPPRVLRALRRRPFRCISRIPRGHSRGARAQIVKMPNARAEKCESLRYARCLIESRCVRGSRRRSLYGPQARRPHFGRRPRTPPPQGCGPVPRTG